MASVAHGSYKLVDIKPSTKADKKFMAEFYNKTEDKTKTIHFGAKGYSDFTLSKNAEQAELYRKRHAKDLLTDAAKTGMSPGALAYWVLWTSPSMAQGIRNFKSQYKL
jgi:hypothetical protein